MTPPTRVVVYSRAGCHLCEDAIAIVDQICDRHGMAYSVVDIDGDDSLLQQYADKVPVTVIDGVEHAIWWVDPDRFEAALR